MATASVTVRSGRRRLFYVSLVTAAAVIIGSAAGLRAAYDGFLLTFPIFNTGNGFSNAWTIGAVKAGTPGAPNCNGDSMASLAQTYGGSAQSATALGFATVTALEAAVADYCTP
jgi:hypothetical protein